MGVKRKGLKYNVCIHTKDDDIDFYDLDNYDVDNIRSQFNKKKDINFKYLEEKEYPIEYLIKYNDIIHIKIETLIED